MSYEEDLKLAETQWRLPLEEIPGSYGLPILGALKDRLHYFYFQGRDKFFQKRIEKYNSTVFRSNMPPGPFISSNPRVIVLLDAKSFPVLFEVSKVEKKDLFTGTYMPSTRLTGGYRVLSYLDPSEPNHAKFKNLIFYLLKSSSRRVIPEFRSTFGKLFQDLESVIASKGKVAFADPNDQASFDFLGRAFFGVHPGNTKLGRYGPIISTIWLGLQLHPIVTAGLPFFLEDIPLHTMKFPSFIVHFGYRRLYNFFYEYAAPILDQAEEFGLDRDEACHNLLFTTCFNTFGGLKILFPCILKWVGLAGSELQALLAKEIRGAVQGGNVTAAALEQMPLMKSVVYEVLRIEPPVPFQYGKAKRDLVIQSHDASFLVKEGEMLFGYQPFATKDPVVFDYPEQFVPDRFMGDGEKLLQYVLWSNGPVTERPTVNNKQCAGKNFVELVLRLFVVELFLRYDSFEIEVSTSALGDAVTITSLVPATTSV